MTLVIAARGKKSIWLVTDRRLTRGQSVERDDAYKTLHLDARDGQALIGYAGLGLTPGGTQPADWMGRVLRDRNLTLDQSIEALRQAIQSQIPRQPFGLDVPIAAFYQGEPQLRGIRLQKDGRYSNERFVGTRNPRLPRMLIAGSPALMLSKDKPFQRDIVRLIDRFEAGRASIKQTAEMLARLNFKVSQKDQTVGPRCIVACRLKEGGGEHHFFSGITREDCGLALPTIAAGMDVRGIIEKMQPFWTSEMEEVMAGRPWPEPDADAINAALASLPHGPDETLD